MRRGPAPCPKVSPISSIAFYQEQYAAALKQAEAAELPSVRERSMRSAAAWQAMVEQLERFESQKARNAELKHAAAHS